MAAPPAVVLTQAEGAVLQPNPQTPFPPVPGKNEVLIRNVAVASNPKDWKLSKFKFYEGIEGNDVAGHIEAVGEGVTEFKKGDKVAGFTKMASGNQYGAYQTLSVCPAWTTFPLGPKTTFEDAATLPLAAMTAAIGLFVKLGMVEPTADGKPNPEAKGKGVLVWAASSSVGAFTVQLAKLAGYYVIGVAGSGAKLAKELGCDAVIDYRTPDVVGQLKAAIATSGTSVTVAYDAHAAPSGDSTSFKDLGEAMQPQGGKITTVLPLQPDAEATLPKNVISTGWTMVGTAHEVGKEDKFAERWFRQLGKWLEEGKFKPNVVRVVPGGLAGVKEGLKLLEEGKISGEKCVYRIAETPNL
ncbi:chaperonin 10-like protein [Hyaloraphidium curvatum]|nr:chaperonin 10-like protein [Hyaloraphidium curvatum]